MIKWIALKLFHYVVGDLTPEERDRVTKAVGVIVEGVAKGTAEGAVDGLKK